MPEALSDLLNRWNNAPALQIHDSSSESYKCRADSAKVRNDNGSISQGANTVRNRTLPGKYTVGCWQELEAEQARDDLDKQVISTKHLKVVRCSYKTGSDFAEHLHDTEQITIVEEGVLSFCVAGDQIEVEAGQMISIFPGVTHSSRVIGDGPAKALNLFYNPQAETT